MEDIYKKAFEQANNLQPIFLNQSLQLSFIEYMTAHREAFNGLLRAELGYYVSTCVEFGVNISIIEKHSDCYTYDYYAFPNEKSRRMDHSHITVMSPQEIYPHRHDYYELVYVLQGSFQHIIADHRVVLHENDMLLLDLNTVHSEYLDGNSVVQYLQIPRSIIQHILDEQVLSSALTDFFSAPKKREDSFRYIHFVHQGAALLRAHIVDLFQERYYRQTGSKYIIYGLLMRLLVRVDRADEYKMFLYKGEEKGNTKIFRMIDRYLERHYWNVDQPAMEAELNYSRDYINRIVRKTTGQTLTEYCISKRLEYAAWLLVRTKMSVNEIVDQCGYRNKTYFYRIFQAKFGFSPKEFRDRYSKLREHDEKLSAELDSYGKPSNRPPVI